MNYYNSETLLEQQQEIEKLKEQNAALAAQVEALRQELCSASDWFSAYWPDLTLEQKERLQQMEKIAKATPQQHLAEIRAQAGLKGYKACLRHIGYDDPDWQHDANQYADSIRRGEVK